jgi:expansin (peptidoglycan-binding protein)
MNEVFRADKDLDFNNDPYGILDRDFVNEAPGVEWVEIQAEHSQSCNCSSCGKATEKTWTPTITSGERTTLIAYEPSYSCYNCGALFLDPIGRMESIVRAITILTEANDNVSVPLLEHELSGLVFQLQVQKGVTRQ